HFALQIRTFRCRLKNCSEFSGSKGVIGVGSINDGNVDSPANGFRFTPFTVLAPKPTLHGYRDIECPRWFLGRSKANSGCTGIHPSASFAQAELDYCLPRSKPTYPESSRRFDFKQVKFISTTCEQHTFVQPRNKFSRRFLKSRRVRFLHFTPLEIR